MVNIYEWKFYSRCLKCWISCWITYLKRSINGTSKDINKLSTRGHSHRCFITYICSQLGILTIQWQIAPNFFILVTKRLSETLNQAPYIICCVCKFQSTFAESLVNTALRILRLGLGRGARNLSPFLAYYEIKKKNILRCLRSTCWSECFDITESNRRTVRIV